MLSMGFVACLREFTLRTQPFTLGKSPRTHFWWYHVVHLEHWTILLSSSGMWQMQWTFTDKESSVPWPHLFWSRCLGVVWCPYPVDCAEVCWVYVCVNVVLTRLSRHGSRTRLGLLKPSTLETAELFLPWSRWQPLSSISAELSPWSRNFYRNFSRLGRD